MDTKESELKKHLQNCAKEQIHIINQIQNHGMILVFDLPSKKCLQYSNNWKEFLKISPNKLNLIKILNTSIIRKLEGPDSGLTSFSLTEYHDENFWSPIQVLAHTIGDALVLECMPKEDQVTVVDNVVATSINEAINRWSEITDITKLSEEVVKFVRSLVGFERVLMYKFDKNDYSGETIAEYALSENRYLGLRFPASDIPIQARKLYIQNPIRVIANVDAPQVALEPALYPKTKSNLDMSLCALRSVSPIHIEYLKNMDVMASMSLSIIVDGELWGLVACHNNKARTISFALMKTLKNLAKVISFIISSIEHRKTTNIRIKFDSILENIDGHLRSETLDQALFKQTPNLLDLAIADGWFLQVKDKVYTSGDQPSNYNHALILDHLRKQPGTLVFTNNATDVIEDYRDSSIGGFMAFHSAMGAAFTFVAYRKQTIQKIKWSGKKSGDTQEMNGYKVLTPRKSFATYEETIKNRSEGWSIEDKFLFETVLDMVSNAISSSNVVLRKEHHTLTERSKEQETIIEQQSSTIEDVSDNLIKRNRDLERLLNTLSGELNDPLNQIQINLSLMNDILGTEGKIETSDAAEMMDTMQESADQITDKLRDLLIELRSISR